MRTTHLLLALACAALAGSAAQSQPKDEAECPIFGTCLSPAALQQAIAKAQAFPLGSARNPVRSDMPPGERAYLDRLRCSDGTAPAYDRAGSVGEGPFGTILDLYQVRCRSGTPAEAQIYMDMYHASYPEDRPVPGFTITPR